MCKVIAIVNQKGGVTKTTGPSRETKGAVLPVWINGPSGTLPPWKKKGSSG